MARGNSKLGRGRGKNAPEESGPDLSAWQHEAPGIPAAPSPARNILPGEPFDVVAPAFPSQRAVEPLGPGWGANAGFPTNGYSPQPSGAPGLADPAFAGWAGAEPATAPFPAVPAGGGQSDPLDALQQYAGLPVGAFPGAAPAPDPGQLHQPVQAPVSGDAHGQPAAPYGQPTAPYGQPAAPYGQPATPYGQPTAPAPQAYAGDQSGASMTTAAPTAAPAQPTQQAPATPAYGSPSSGFADGGIFTGTDYAQSEQFDGIPSSATTFAPESFAPQNFAPQNFESQNFGSQNFGPQAPQTFAPQGPSFGPQDFGQQAQPGQQPHHDLEPLDVTPMTAGAYPPPGPDFGQGFGVAGGLSSVLPGDDEEGGRHGRRRRRAKTSEGKRRSGGERDGFDPLSGMTSAEAPAEHRSSGSRRVVALLGAVAVLGAAGYLGYSQLAGTDQAVSSPVVPTKPAVSPKPTLPPALANLTQIPPAQAKALTASYTTLTAKSLPTLPAPLAVTAYHAQNDVRTTVNVVVYRAGKPGAYETLVGSLSHPSPGNASIAAVPVAPGAAGGQMLCGSQRGASSMAWCAWSSPKSVGFLSTKGSANPTFAAIYTRELRAYADH